MSWRFRKTFKVMPGLKLNLTARGLSATIGASPLSVNVGPRGVYGNVGIPGTGVWTRERLDAPSLSPVVQPPPFGLSPVTPGGSLPAAVPALPALPISMPPQITEVRSASTELLNSATMEDLRKLLEEAHTERAALSQEVAAAEREHTAAARRYRNWDSGFLFKRVFRRAFAIRKETSETAQAKLEELREQLRLTTVATQIDMDPEQAEAYYRMRDDFAALTECQKVWDTLERRAVDRVIERSAAHEAITREPVAFSLDSCDLIEWEQKVPHLPNRNSGDLYMYPGFIVYRASRQAFALIDTREVTLAFSIQRFIEHDPVPSDTQVVGQAWAKSNKDGSPDRRFRNNYQVPIVLYGSLAFRSTSGLQEEYQCSNPVVAERFAKAWNASKYRAGPAVPPAGPNRRRPIAVFDIDGPYKRFSSATDDFFKGLLACEVGPDGMAHGTMSKDDFSAYIRIVSEFVDAARGFPEDIAAAVEWAESLGVPKRKLSSLRTMLSSFRAALEQFEMACVRFGNIWEPGRKFTTEDFTAYADAVATFLRALGVFRDGSVTAVEKLTDSMS